MSALVMLLLVTCFLLAESLHRLQALALPVVVRLLKRILLKVKSTKLFGMFTYAFSPSLEQEALVRSGCSFRRDWCGTHGGEALSLRGLPLSPAGEGPRFSVLLVDCVLLKRNAAVVLSRSCGRALELLEVAYYNIVIVDANSLGPSDMARFHTLASAHSLLFVGVVADGTYADDYALFDMQALRPLNETTMDIILKVVISGTLSHRLNLKTQVEEITAQKLFLLERSAATASSSSGKGGTAPTADMSPMTSWGVDQHTTRSPNSKLTDGSHDKETSNNSNALLIPAEGRTEKSGSNLFNKIFRNVLVCGWGSGY